jgi:hypothetical protein
MGTAPTLENRLNQARRSRFVGRDAEIDLFRSLIAEPVPTVAVVYVWGPGGVGKSSLLDIYGALALEAGATPLRVDARDIDRSPEGLRVALAQRLGLPDPGRLEDELAARPRPVLMFDTYELIAPIDDWIRETFLPGLPESALVILAGRNRPSAGWRSDSGWASLTRIVPLRNLRPDEAEALLRHRAIPADRSQTLIDLSYGHPLALSLLADLEEQRDGAPLSLEGEPDLVRTLLDRFLRETPEDPWRMALEVCAHTRVTTEALLRDVLELDDVSGIFAWLRDLSFVQEGPEGIFPHDLARDALDADVRWRDRRRYQEMHAQVRAPIIRAIRQSRGVEQQRAIFDLLYLHRTGPVMGRIYEWTTLGSGRIEPVAPELLPDILAMVERFEGPESAAIARFWYERQPEGFMAFRDVDGQLFGFCAALVLQQPDSVERDADPALAAIWDYTEQNCPLRPGEVMVVCRFAMDAQAHQGVSHGANMFQLCSVQVIFTTERMALMNIVMSRSEIWPVVLEYLTFSRLESAAVTIGGHDYDVFGKDWRAMPVERWMEVMGEREIAAEAPPPSTSDDAPLLVLSRPDFDQAVRDALRQVRRPAALASNPLTRSRLVLDRADGGDPAEALATLLRETIDALRSTPRDEKLYRALHRTYLDPADSQELAAESLGLAFNTYRYHLSGGLRRVCDALWTLELDR